MSKFNWGGKTYNIVRPDDAQPESRGSDKGLSRIHLGTKNYSIAVDQTYGRNASAAYVQTSRVCTRYAEQRLTVLESGRALVLTQLEQQLLHLERVAMDPARYGGDDRPARPLSGVYLYGWIGSRAGGYTARATKKMLDKISGKLAVHERIINLGS